MKELEEQGVCVKYCCKLGRKFTETFELLHQVYGEDCMSGLSVLKRAECRSVKMPGQDDLPHQQMVTMSREFVL
jgi:hypothetical protein